MNNKVGNSASILSIPMHAVRTLKEFLRLESASGIILFFAAVLAVVFENTGFQSLYESVRAVPVSVQIGDFGLRKPFMLWVNDGLMAIFFLLVGLELKREFVRGQLASRSGIILPMAAALGGIIVPSLIYITITSGNAEAVKGWAIPAATDIAFALGVLSLFGSRVPLSMKMFITALAVIDDLAAIVIIALFYTSNLSMMALGSATICLAALFICNRVGVKAVTPYVLIGIILWVSVLKSGVHATLAGVLLAFSIPATKNGHESPLERFEHALHPWVAFLVLPLFAFMNAGVSLTGLSAEHLLHPVVVGVSLGLFVGKQLGVFFATWLVYRSGLVSLPSDLTLPRVYALSLLAGIGFTMSLFIGTLAFQSSEYLTFVRLGVIVGSILSGITAYIALSMTLKE